MELEYYKQLLYDNGYIPNLSQNQMNICCPFHNEVNGKSLSINFNKNIFKCFSGKCKDKKGSIYKLLVLLDLIEENKKEIVNKTFKININVPKINNIEEEKELEIFDLNRYNYYHTNNYEYLKQRGISEEIQKENKITYNKFTDRIYIPIWIDKKCYGIVGRTIFNKNKLEEIFEYLSIKENRVNNDEFKKEVVKGNLNNKYPKLKIKKPFDRYINNFGLNKNLIVFEPLTNNYKNDILLIVEGQINALTINEYNYNSIAIIGSHPTLSQIEYILNLKQNIILAFDNDIAGDNNIKEFRKISGINFPKLNFNLLDKKVNDINELKKEELEFLINNKSYL